MNDVIRCLMNHRSVRQYTDRKIEPETLDMILKAGTRAATGGNLQLYSILVIDDPKRLAELDQALEVPFIVRSNCSTAILAMVDLHRVRKWLTMHGEREVITDRPYNFFMAIWDSLIALQNMVVAAESLGLGTCYLGSGVELDIQKLYGAPKLVFPSGLVCLGYPASDPKMSMRLPLDAVVHRNEYRMPSNDDIDEWYEKRDRVWDNVPEERKALLAEQGIEGIAQALSVQKFSHEIVEKRSRGILRNLRQSTFDLHTGMDET